MSENRHTPGPWEGFIGEDGAFTIEDEGAVLCQRAPWPHNKDESRANAKLIMAAPELLIALETVRAHLLRLAWEENSLMIEGIDKAISKATSD